MGMFTALVIVAMQTITNEALETSQNSPVRQHALRRTAHSTEASTDPINRPDYKYRHHSGERLLNRLLQLDEA